MYNSSQLVEGENEVLKQLCELVKADDRVVIEKLIESRSELGRSSIYSDIEFDIKGFYELDQNIERSIVLRDEFVNESRAAIKRKLLKRIKSVKPKEFELPERLFRVKVLRIKYNKSLIDVALLRRENWIYSLYKSINYSDEYYLDKVFEGVAPYTKVFKVSKREANQIISRSDDKLYKYLARYKSKKGT